MAFYERGSWAKENEKQIKENSAPVQYRPSASDLKALKQKPAFKSELLDKLVVKKDFDAAAALSKRNNEALTTGERGAVSRTGLGFSDAAEQAGRASISGGISPAVMIPIRAKQLYDFRASDQYRVAKNILESASETDLFKYDALKEASKVRDLFASSTGDERWQHGQQLNEMLAGIEGVKPGSLTPDDMGDPFFLEYADATLGSHLAQLNILDYADGVISKAEELKKGLGLVERPTQDYVKLPPEQQMLMRQNLLFDYENGASAINFNVGEEYALLEDQAISLTGTHTRQDGTKVPEYVNLAENSLRETQELRGLIQDALMDAEGTPTYARVLKSATRDLKYLEDKERLEIGFLDRYAKDADDLAKQGKAKYNADKGFDQESPFGLPLKTADPLFSPLKAELIMPVFEATWKKKLEDSAKSNNGQPDPELVREYNIKYKAQLAKGYKKLSDSEILGQDDPALDVYRVNMMTPQEQKTYFAYYAQDGDKAHSYAKALDLTLSKRASEYEAEAARLFASGDVWQQGAAGLISVLNTVEKTKGLLYVTASQARGDLINPYSASFMPSVQQQAAREQLKENTIARFGKDSIATKALSFGMDTVFGAGDSILAAKTLGLWTYSAVGGADATKSALIRGGNQEEAFALGVITMFAEVATEAIPFDNLNKGFSTGFTLRGLAVSVGGETFGEAMSALIGDQADREIMLDRSEYEIAVREYQDQGLSLDDARKQATQDAITGYLYEGLVGGASGGLSYGTAGAWGSINRKGTKAEQSMVSGAVTPSDVTGSISGILAEFETGGNAPPMNDTGRMTELEVSPGAESMPAAMQATDVDIGELQALPGVDMDSIMPLEGEYDPDRAGSLLVYERADGTRQIADGYRRWAKAKEIGLDAMPAQVLLESDGIAPGAAEALGRIRNSQDVDVGQLSGLDQGLLSRAADGLMDMQSAQLVAQAFPRHQEMQREYWRLLAGRDMSPAAQTELARNLKIAQDQAIANGDNSLEFMNRPEMETVAERSEVAARVSGMLAQGLRTDSELSRNTTEAANQMMQEYQQGGEAFDALESAAQDYAAGDINLREAAVQAYEQIKALAFEAADALMREPAIQRAADSVQALVGQFGHGQVRDFFSGALKAMDGADYAAQQDTVANIREAVMLPVEAPSRALLESMVAGETQVLPETLGELNRLAAQDLSAPEYQDAIESNREEALVSRQVASEISKGALSDMESRAAQVDGLEQTAITAQAESQQADAALESVTQIYQNFVAEVLNPPAITPDMQKRQNSLLQQISTAKAEQARAQKQFEKAQSAYAAAEQNYQANYSDQLNAIRRAALTARAAQVQAQQAAAIQTDGQAGDALKTQNSAIQGYAMHETALPVEMPARATKPGPVQSALAIFNDLGKALDVPYNTNRKQYLRQLKKSAAGYFVPANNTVHVQSAQDINVAAHEFGHYLDKTLRLGSHPMVGEIVAFLKQAAPEYTASYKPSQLPGEAVAEVVKTWMTNRDQAVRQFGDLVRDMEAGMKQTGVFKAFDQARLALERTLTADVMAQTKARVKMDDDTGGVKELFRWDAIEKFRAKVFDHTLPLDKLTKAEMKALGDDFQFSQDARHIALKNNRVDNYIRQNIENNLVDVFGDVVLDRGFADNFKGIKKKQMRDFSNYLLLNHELDRSRVDKSIYKNQFTQEQVATTIADYERNNPTWKEARSNLNEWYDAFMREYVVKQGVLTLEEYETMHAMYPNYVPTYRVMDSGDSGFRGSRDAQKGLKRAGKSDLDIKNPIENMARQVMYYTRQAHQLHLANTFADQIDRLGDMGYIAERVQPDAQYSPEIQNLIKKAEARAALHKQAMVKNDPDINVDSLNDLEATIINAAKESVFTLSDQATGANVVNILGKDGNYRSYVVHDPGVLKVIANTSPSQSSALFKIVGGLTRMISVTATSANALFAVTNAVRDMMSQMIWGSVSTNPGTEALKWAAMLPQTWMAKHGKGKYADAYRTFETMAEMGSKYSMQIGRSSKAMMEAATQPKSIKSLAGKAIKIVTLQNVNELIENTTRFMEYVHGKSGLGGKNVEHLDSYEGKIRAMIAATGVTVDFARKGSSPVMQQLGALVPFLNAGLQGVHKTLSLFSHENKGRRGQIVAKMTFNGLMLGVVSSLLLNMMLDEDEKTEYEQMDEGFKNTNVFVKLGKEQLLRIPLSQDALFQTLYAGGRMLAQAFTGDGGTDPDADRKSVV